MITILRNIALGISLAAPPGPASVTVIQNGLRGGFVHAFLTGIGVTLADATYMLLVFFGLSRILEAQPVKIVLWSLGALVLTYFGLRNLRERQARFDQGDMRAAASRNPVIMGYGVNAFNPIAAIWWLGIFGALLGESAAGGTRAQALGLSSTILVGIFAWHSTVALLTHWGRRFLSDRFARTVSVAAGVALLLFGLQFAYRAYLSLGAG